MIWKGAGQKAAPWQEVLALLILAPRLKFLGGQCTPCCLHPITWLTQTRKNLFFWQIYFQQYLAFLSGWPNSANPNISNDTSKLFSIFFESVCPQLPLPAAHAHYKWRQQSTTHLIHQGDCRCSVFQTLSEKIWCARSNLWWKCRMLPLPNKQKWCEICQISTHPFFYENI